MSASGSNSSLFKNSDGSQLNTDEEPTRRRRLSGQDNAVRPMDGQPATKTPAATLDPDGAPGSRTAFQSKRSVAFSLGKDEESKSLPTLQEGTLGLGPSPPPVNTAPHSGRMGGASTPNSRTLKSCDSLAAHYDGSVLSRHPSHPFMFFNTCVHPRASRAGVAVFAPK